MIQAMISSMGPKAGLLDPEISAINVTEEEGKKH